jgi:hypothetical protein
MNWFDRIILLLTGLTAAYLVWRFWRRYNWEKKVYMLYYMMSFVVLFISGVLLIFMGYGILSSPFVLTVASLIPLGISIGIIRQCYEQYLRPYTWFATIGFLAIAVSSFAGWELVRKISIPLFHGVAGLVIFLGPFLVKKYGQGKKAADGFWWVGMGGVLIGLGGIALAFLSVGSQLLFFSQSFVLMILAPLLLLMTLAFTFGFVKDIKA